MKKIKKNKSLKKIQQIAFNLNYYFINKMIKIFKLHQQNKNKKIKNQEIIYQDAIIII